MPAAVTDAYSTAADYRTYASVTDTTGFNADAVILQHLTAVSRYIDRRLANKDGPRFFTQDAAVVARIYYPPYPGRTLKVADIASTSGLTIKQDSNLTGAFTSYTAWATTDYQLLPLNADKGSDARPWTTIFIPYWSTQYWFTPQIPVQVTAIWGWPAIPAQIVQATLELTKILRLQGPRATSRVNELGETLQQSPEAERIVWSLWQTFNDEVTF